MIKLFETFAGVGSQRVALNNINAPYKSVGILEINRYGLVAYDAIHNDMSQAIEKQTDEYMHDILKKVNVGMNFANNKNELPKKGKALKQLYEAHIRSNNYGDITLIDEKELPNMNLLTYSFPCKDISNAGLSKGLDTGSGTKSSLLWEVERIIAFHRPKYLLMENVKTLISKKHFPNFQKWCDVLSQLGYNNYYEVMDASNFVVPQHRERVMMVSILKNRDGGFKMPTGVPTKFTLSDFLLSEDDVGDEFYCSESFKNTLNRAFGSRGKILDRGKRICPTLLANAGLGGGNMHCLNCNNGVIRKITPNEYWRLMGFKDEVFRRAKDVGGLSNSKLYERAGRSIAIQMLEQIFTNMFIAGGDLERSKQHE